jgi:hypothetical protein
MDKKYIKKIEKIVNYNSKKNCYEFDYINNKIYIKKISYDIVDFNNINNTNDDIIKYALLTINQ